MSFMPEENIPTIPAKNYEFALALMAWEPAQPSTVPNGIDVLVFRDGYKYELHFEKGENIGGLKKDQMGIMSSYRYHSD